MEPTMHFQFDNTKNGLSKDTAVHFWGTQFPVDKDNRYFHNLETAFVSSEFHFNLEGITFEADTIQIDCLQYLTTIALKAGGAREAKEQENPAQFLAEKEADRKSVV